MKNVFIKLGVASVALTMASCNSEVINIEDEQNEHYLRDFVTTFGVPAPDHSYAMAQSAGLHVTTKKGGHVSVIAEVRGQEYLFADLDVTPGTHALPVTVPASVSELKVVTSYGVHIVSTSATVDIDTPPAGSRAGNYIIEDPSNDGDMIFIDTEEGQYPYLAFKPSDFLQRYFELNPENQDNVDNLSDFKLGTRKYPVYDANGKELPVLIPDATTFETAFGTNMSTNGVTYYIFPIYWQRDREGRKDYKAILHKIRNGAFSGLYSPWEIPVGGDDPNIPFPNLGYSSTISSLPDIDLSRLDEQFTYDDGSFDKAFDPDAATMVISRGVKVKMHKVEQTNSEGKVSYYQPGFAMAVESGFNADGSFDSFSSSSPFHNGWFWGEKYYDVPLNTMYLALCSSRGMFINNSTLGKPGQVLFPNPPKTYIHDGLDHSDLCQGGANYNRYFPWFKDGEFFGKESTNNRLVGFSPSPTKAGDRTPRDFRDVIFLVIPHVENNVFYRTVYTELPPAFEWTIAAEDLGGSYDWDFNDAVFTFTDVIRNLKTEHLVSSVAMANGPLFTQSVRIITVTPKAAGGTMPLYITYTGPVKKLPEVFTTREKTTEIFQNLLKLSYMQGKVYATDAFIYEDKMFSEADAELKAYLQTDAQEATYVLGCEIHTWLGHEDYTTQYNVGAERAGINPKAVQFVIPTDLDLADEDKLGYYGGLSAASKNNQPLFGFSVLVDKDNTLNIQNINDDGFTRIDGYALGEGTYLVGAPSDNKELTAPQMILVEGDWQWPSELTNIKDAYPSFAAWIQNPQENSDWHTKPAEGRVTKK